MTGARVLAVDLGATSVRVAAVDLSAGPDVKILHRWHHEPIVDEVGSLRWDWRGILEHVEHGLEAGIHGGDVASIGVDGWGVDYGLLDDAGSLLDLPYAYRDDRTNGWKEVADRIGTDRLYSSTGIQLMGINTIFQLAADAPDRLAAARTLMLLPDLLVNHLTGWTGCEVSNMSTTGLMHARTRAWATDLVDAIGISTDILPQPAAAGTPVGSWRGVPVHLVGSHDTASAFVGTPFDDRRPSVFVSAGSWVLVGTERNAADTSTLARELNFSNEAGAFGGVRFLRNVVGFWILEQCRAAWGDPPIDLLVAEAETATREVPTFDAGDHRFVGAHDMLSEVLNATGLTSDTPRSVVARSVIESIVAGVVRVIDDLESLTDKRPTRAFLVGGGSRIPIVKELLSERAGVDVVVGSPEATALGNAIAQGIALRVIDSIEDGRSWLESANITEQR